MKNAVKARFALLEVPHVPLCTLRQIVLAQSQALTPFFIGLCVSIIHNKTILQRSSESIKDKSKP
ncbi:MAG: hypothetical protein A2Y14_02680 [Verrucomicrobia bacterium GWF2_51_19]|nr:MAG: hypothetical protein A2Y14_02680 [Verrucomicrobia bacterium GWF2_51_19]HCJ12247.1 hypothetical protein [Opitutae bacterium]